MNRLNPYHADIGIFVSFFLPTNKFYEDIQGDNVKQFLSSNGITNEGQHTIAKYYGVFTNGQLQSKAVTRLADITNHYFL
jgi:hypothetical protein